MSSTHPFQKSGHGSAPFKCVGYEQSWHGGGTSGAPKKPGSCCDHCATGIAHVFWIVSAEGNRFKVGSECVRKTGDAPLKEETIRVRKTEEQKERDRKHQVQKKERAEQRAAEIAERVAAAEPWLLKLYELTQSKNDWVARTSFDMGRKICEGMPLTVPMMSLIEKLFTESRIVKGYVGKVGAAVETDVVISRVTYVGEFSIPGTWQKSHCYRWHFRDAVGNELIWKTSKGPHSTLAIRCINSAGPGERERDVPTNLPVKLRGKIKEHSEFNGEKQTVLERCKVTRLDTLVKEEEIAAE